MNLKGLMFMLALYDFQKKYLAFALLVKREGTLFLYKISYVKP